MNHLKKIEDRVISIRSRVQEIVMAEVIFA